MSQEFDPLNQLQFASSTRGNGLVKGFRVDGVNVNIDGKPILFEVNISPILPSCVVGIVGPSGSGKTVLLQTMAGILKPKNGSIFNGHLNISSLNERERFDQVSYLSPPGDTHSMLSVFDVISHSLKHTEGWHVKDDEASAVKRVLNDISLSDLAKRPLSSLNSAERQLVALGQIIVRNPRVLLLDELEQSLDVQVQTMIYKIVRKVATERNMIAVCAFKEFEFADKLSGRIIRIYKGRVVDHE